MDSATYPVSKIKVLVADDNGDLAWIASFVLTQAGFQVQTCSNGSECITCAQDFTPHIIFLDIDMPVMDGMQACRYIRQQQWGAHIPIVALTSHEHGQIARQLKEAGFDLHLTKPTDYQQLPNLITNIINAKQLSIK